MAQGVVDLAQHQPDLRGVGFLRRFAQVGVQRRKQGRFVRPERVAELAQLPLAEGLRARRTRLKIGALALDGGGDMHKGLRQTSPGGYSLVK